MSTWANISALVTAGCTLVLAFATFASVRSANRAARAAERSLLDGLRPLLVPSRLLDPPEKISFADRHLMHVGGGQGRIEVEDEVIYLGMALRNAGRGMAVLHGWCARPGSNVDNGPEHFPLDSFRQLNRDLYVPAGDLGFWQGAVRDPADQLFDELDEASGKGESLTIELLYGDHEGGQRMITRFGLLPLDRDDGRIWMATASRHWNLDRADPRRRPVPPPVFPGAQVTAVPGDQK